MNTAASGADQGGGAPSGPNNAGSDLKPRIMSAIVLIVIAIGVTWFGGLVFGVAMACLSALVFYEWCRITGVGGSTAALAVAVAILAVALVLMLAGYMIGAAIVAVGGGLVLAGLGAFGAGNPEFGARALWAGPGIIYAFVAGFCLVVVRDGRLEADPGFGLLALMFLFLTVWATDILAYFSGRRFGGPKLLPKVSPKKTWSGAAGGMAGAVMIGIAAYITVPQFAVWLTIPLAILLSFSSQCGDLFESWIKRRFGVKDSSNLIPGHGGFMDRVDGLTFAAVTMALAVAFSLFQR